MLSLRKRFDGEEMVIGTGQMWSGYEGQSALFAFNRKFTVAATTLRAVVTAITQGTGVFAVDMAIE